MCFTSQHFAKRCPPARQKKKTHKEKTQFNSISRFIFISFLFYIILLDFEFDCSFCLIPWYLYFLLLLNDFHNFEIYPPLLIRVDFECSTFKSKISKNNKKNYSKALKMFYSEQLLVEHFSPFFPFSRFFISPKIAILNL